MKKLRKSLSYITKVFLVFGLLFSNLSSLSVVFAYEATDDFTVILTDDNKIKVNYLQELDDTDVINVEISENYTYLDNSPETSLTDSVTTTGADITSDTGIEIVSAMMSNVIFDGLYEVSVSLYNETDAMELGTVLYSQNIEHESGLDITVTDSANNVISLTDGSYSVNDGIVNVEAKIKTGGLVPSSVIYSYDELEYSGKSLVELVITDSFDLSGRLYGEYVLPLEVKVMLDTEEEMIFTENLSVMYNSYNDNTLALNSKLNEIIPGSSYLFEGATKDGILYVMPNGTDTHSVLDVVEVLDEYVLGNDKITYTISNSENVSLEQAYVDYVATVPETEVAMTREEFYTPVMLDDTTVITLSSEGQTVTYKVVVFADLNNDGLLTEEDLTLLIEQSVGTTDVVLDKSDMNDDEVLDMVDAIYLYNTLITGSWDNALEENSGTLDARLEVATSDIVSGDTFDINYILTLNEYKTNGIEGLVKYDDTILELVSVTNMTTWKGSNKDGKFLYLGEESLQGIMVENTEPTEGTEELLPEVTYEDKDYVVLTLTFRALKSDATVVEVTDLNYADGMSLLDTTGLVVATEVVINKSVDNTLASLTVAGQTIELQEDVLEYTINVDNETVEAVVDAVVNNVAASISSIVAPEELAEGENTITIVVMAENGDEKVYTIKVIREEAPEETTTQVTYQEPVYEEPEVEVTEPVEDVEDEEPTKEVPEESNLSRIVIIILILLVVAGLIYLIFKDDSDEETKKVNKDINKMKKDNDFKESNNDTNKKSNSDKKKDKGKNNKKGR